MYKYFISILFVLFSVFSFAQGKNEISTDSITYKKSYGLRAGIDIASLIRTGIDPEYTGFQILADYRLTDRLYIAGELGNESLDRTSESVDYESTGQFLKAGVDYNFYQNWLEMDNMIYGGARLGFANFSQTLTRYDYNVDNNYFPIFTNAVDREFSGLNMVWIEIQLGIKVEVLNNLYVMANFQLKRRLTENAPSNFANLYAPGFGRTFDTGNIGVGYAYGIMYRIPFFKK
ncbi:hypothetical protein LX97_00198 [Nonlabens dokdonensis]|uniref:Outer membrane protein beta-barrel domain-containing protein n=2 Tax=Nonlabens dokdonensis TaxID=328515 RepID=L7W5N2_NONDD|nr:DUF6048 family protein [Nonlabens dokdonensis]AGC75502.1 hypothetical protein DDD_0375 [Nonlabens dokdonensis DSW-6]PZX43198.1 hypothetical protein LX97_00198 [Nonlabens dokdonensis]